ncbi:hypothetical protein AXF42_Ash017585 [Apostasia shenzhenica]|uniref:Uncharacterized protein n=1 Tax=Apostasia shenzhenica TaxID=1088818 RepID=A0A2I0A591_9ASPA|nr:hypothetical protein AXF42_Ash017585 [Apostasia shenzhenica]
MAWCSHCGGNRRTLLDVYGGYVSCFGCGKVLEHFGSPTLNGQNGRHIREILDKGESEESESHSDGTSYFESEGGSDVESAYSESSTIEQIEEEFGEKMVMADVKGPGSVVGDNDDCSKVVEDSYSSFGDDYYGSEDVDYSWDVDYCWDDDYSGEDDDH